MLPRFPCGSIRNIRFACFDFENDEGREPTLTNVVVLKLHLVVVVVVVFTLKAVPVSTQYFLTSVLVQLPRTPSVVTG